MAEERPLLSDSPPPPYNTLSSSPTPLQRSVGDPQSPNGSPKFTYTDDHSNTSNITSRLKRAYRFQSLLAVKPIEAFLAEREARPKGRSLAERLGLIDLLGYGVGSTVGAGIYSLIGIGVGIAGECGE